MGLKYLRTRMEKTLEKTFYSLKVTHHGDHESRVCGLYENYDDFILFVLNLSEEEGWADEKNKEKFKNKLLYQLINEVNHFHLYGGCLKFEVLKLKLNLTPNPNREDFQLKKIQLEKKNDDLYRELSPSFKKIIDGDITKQKFACIVGRESDYKLYPNIKRKISDFFRYYTEEYDNK